MTLETLTDKLLSDPKVKKYYDELAPKFEKARKKILRNRASNYGEIIMEPKERLAKLTESIEKTKETIEFFRDKGDIKLSEDWEVWLAQQEFARDKVVQELEAMSGNELLGARLMKIEYGLVSDLKTADTGYGTPYYLLLLFAKGQKLFHHYFPVSEQLNLPQAHLGKIIKSNERVDGKNRFLFTTGDYIEFFLLDE